MKNKMEKRYGLPTAISMVIGIVIGSGVFIKGGKVLSLTGGNLIQVRLLRRLVYDHDLHAGAFGNARLFLGDDVFAAFRHKRN